MSTQATALSVGTNPESSRENTRSLMALTQKHLNFYRFTGDMDDARATKTYIKDYHIPTPIDAAATGGVRVESDLKTRVAVPTQVVSQMHRWADDAQVQFGNEGESIPGNLGDLDTQGRQLILDAMEVVNKRGEGNFATVKGTAGSSGVAGEAASPVTYAESIINIGAGTFTGGGYDANSETTSTILDGTSDDDRRDLSLDDIVSGVAQLHENLDGGNVNMERLRDSSYVAYIPTQAYARLTRNDTSGIAALNQFNSSVGDTMVPIMNLTVSQLKTSYGMVTLFPITNQIGTATGDNTNNIVVIARGDATNIIYKVRPTTVELKDRVIDKRVGVNMLFTIQGPAPQTITGIVGVDSSATGATA